MILPPCAGIVGAGVYPHVAMANRELQKAGEDAAALYLARLGMRVVARNWRLKLGELDVVAMDGNTLVFVEVKTKDNSRFADPALSVGLRKQRKLRLLAEAYIAMARPSFVNCRFDVVSVVADANGPTLRHICQAF